MKSGARMMTDPDRWSDSLDLIRATIDAVESPIAVVDSEVQILLANQRWTGNLLARGDNIRSVTDRIISASDWHIGAEEASRFASSLDQVLAGQHGECRLRAGSSGSLPTPTLICARAFAIGKATAMIVLLAPASQRARKPGKDLQVKPIESAAFEISAKGTVLNWSSDAAELFGRKENEIVGGHVSRLLTRHAPRFPSKALLASLERDSTQPIEIE
jgi:hypothetical protein